jgi:hypothetical protein
MQGYVLLSLTSAGQMPWSGASSDTQCLQIKEECDIEVLSVERGCPEVSLKSCVSVFLFTFAPGWSHHLDLQTAIVGTGGRLRTMSTALDGDEGQTTSCV